MFPEETSRKRFLSGTQHSLDISARADYYVKENGGLVIQTNVVMQAMDWWKGRFLTLVIFLQYFTKFWILRNFIVRGLQIVVVLLISSEVESFISIICGSLIMEVEKTYACSLLTETLSKGAVWVK